MKRKICTKLMAILLVTVLLAGVVPAAFAAEGDPTSAQQIGAYYEANDTTGALAAEPAMAEGTTWQSYEDGKVLVNKTITGTDKENVFDVNLEVITSDKIEQLNLSEDAAAVLVIDTSLSMQGSKLDNAKIAAQAFINSFANSDGQRKIAIVKFSGIPGNNGIDGAKTVQTWTDASAIDTNSSRTQCAEIRGLSADGYTNIEAGLILAKNLLAQDAVSGIDNKNIILLTDGKPTLCVGSGADKTSATVICPNGNNMIGNGLSTSHAMHTNVENLVKMGLDSGTTPYAVFVGNENVNCQGNGSCDLNAAGSQWLAQAGFTAFAASDSGNLESIFEDISHLIQIQARAWILTDPMGEYIDFTQFNRETFAVDEFTVDNDTVTWNLRRAKPVVGGTDTNPTYTYNLSYRIKLDTLKNGYSAGKYYPANGVTALTYVITTTNNEAVSFKDGTAYFNVPSVKGYAGSITLNKADTFGEALSGAEFTLTTADDAGFSRKATSDANGKIILRDIPSGHSYALTETKAPEGYTGAGTAGITVAWGEAAASGISNGTIVNTSVTKDITVTKEWKDDSNRDGLRPDVLALTLNADGAAVTNAPAVKKDGNTWTYTWNALPAYKGGKAIVYTVDELDVTDGYTKSVDGMVVTNTHAPSAADVTATKVWKDASNRDNIRPEELVLTLYADGAVVNAEPIVEKDSDTWTYTWKNLPVNDGGKAIIYTVDELTVPEGYTKNVDGMVVTNSYDPAITSVTAAKIWDDDSNRDGLRPEELELVLYANGKPTDAEATVVKDGDTWTYKWENLPKFLGGEEIIYTVIEEEVPTGYTAAYSDDTFTITNTHEIEKMSVTVVKKWDDADNQDGIRPDEIKVQLLKNGVVYKEGTLTADKGWFGTWIDLPVYENGEEIVWTVKEASDAPGYVAGYDGFTITNTHETETTDKTVTKVWNDYKNKDNKRPSSISVQLYADGKAVGEPVKLTEKDGWAHTWTGLDVYKDGNAIEYTVKETEVPEGYTVRYSKDTFTVINTLKDIPSTGDTFNFGLWIALLAASAVVLVTIPVVMKKKKNTSR